MCQAGKQKLWRDYVRNQVFPKIRYSNFCGHKMKSTDESSMLLLIPAEKSGITIKNFNAIPLSFFFQKKIIRNDAFNLMQNALSSINKYLSLEKEVTWYQNRNYTNSPFGWVTLKISFLWGLAKFNFFLKNWMWRRLANISNQFILFNSSW